ncbi:hypothetical protein [Vulcanisaeta thermophila]|uniref:hypothetical protein n=1 Tax=Vulcanisaeta thermophila TaxID=867917 RepID=UPI000852A37D|nr:hypothetical protein [Vulcanisaeta thermophila]
MSQQTQARPSTAYVLSLIGSILMLISAVVELAALIMFSVVPYHRFGYMPMPFIFGMGAVLIVLGIVGIIISALALYFSLRLNKVGDVNAVHSTGIILLVLSIIGLFVANGFIVGFILLLIGSVMAMTWKP